MMRKNKKLKQAYKERKAQMGVFLIRNVVTDKVFMDGHTDVQARYNRHIATLKFGNHRNAILQKDWNQMGQSNFSYELLSELKYETTQSDYTQDIKELITLYKEELNFTIENSY